MLSEHGLGSWKQSALGEAGVSSPFLSTAPNIIVYNVTVGNGCGPRMMVYICNSSTPGTRQADDRVQG